LLAALDEGFDAETLDFFFAMETEFFANFDFDGEPMSIPASFSFATEAAHRAVPRKEILDRAGQAMARMG
jgi:hypothetical protein